MNKHPHAELMKQYAEDAMKSKEPWDLWLTRKNGDCNWVRCASNPVWSECYEYKRRASVVMVGGIEFPEPYNLSTKTNPDDVFTQLVYQTKVLLLKKFKDIALILKSLTTFASAV